MRTSSLLQYCTQRSSRSNHSLSLRFFISSMLLCLMLLPLSVPVRAAAEEEISLAPADHAGVDVVLVMDVSGSMEHTDPAHLSGQSAEAFLSALPPDTSRAGLITFSHELQTVTELLPLTDSKQSEEALPSSYLDALTYTSGDTDIGLALERAVRLLLESPPSPNPRCIVLLTDGEIDLPNAEDEPAAEEASLKQALVAGETAKDHDILLHTITLDPGNALDHSLMGYLAERTGGTARIVEDPALLYDAFREAAEQTLRIASEASRDMENPDGVSDAASETGPETEAETETEIMQQELLPIETEAETEAPPAVLVSGSVDGPILLQGFLPSFCSGTVDLRAVFSGSMPLSYTAYAEDGALLSCTVEGDLLTLRGLRSGQTTVWIFAQPKTDPFSDPENLSAASDPAQISFSVQIHPLIPNLLIPLIGLLALVLLTGSILMMRSHSFSGHDMQGQLQWIVKGEAQKVFGMPEQNSVSLSAYGSRVRLSELVEDVNLMDVPLSKVLLRSHRGGVRIHSGTSACLLSRSGQDVCRTLDLYQTSRFFVRCRTESGPITIQALYAPTAFPDTFHDAAPADERTRLLSAY